MTLVSTSRRVGTLGGPGTFAGQAAEAALALIPTLGQVQYFPTMDDVWEAVYSGEVDCGILTGETSNTGLTEIAVKLLDRSRPCFVEGEVVVPYRCMLLGKPGATLDQVRLVLGHGSLRQCRGFLDERLPGVEVRVHEKNSLAAAAEALEGDGTVAVVGTLRSAQENNLAVLATDIDRGSEGAWWLLTRSLRAVEDPEVLIVGTRSGDRTALGALLARMASIGYTPRSIASVSTGTLFEYEHLVVFTGRPLMLPLGELLEGLDGCWQIGAFSSGSGSAPASDR